MPTPERAAILQRAQGMLNIPYLWGGDSSTGSDCSAFVSRAWGIPRSTTDSIGRYAVEISRDELQPGDALNLPTWRDPTKAGHIRLFAGWANSTRTMIYVYEQTSATGKSVYRAIPYDPRYTPLRLRTLAAAEPTMTAKPPEQGPSPAPGWPPQQPTAPAAPATPGQPSAAKPDAPPPPPPQARPFAAFADLDVGRGPNALLDYFRFGGGGSFGQSYEHLLGGSSDNDYRRLFEPPKFSTYVGNNKLFSA